jgi:FkbM family methyltransferase
MALAPLLRLKHRVATSPLAGPAATLRGALSRARAALRPELGLMHHEDALRDRCLARLIRPDWNCWDVGGHLGSVSYTLSRLAPRGHLTIVEAAPAKAAALRSRFPRATVHQVAVSDAPGTATFHENLSNPGFSSLSDRQAWGRTRAYDVTLARIDDLSGDRPVHFLKIDVEGHEPAALRGAARTLDRDRPAILFEAGDAADPDTDPAAYDALFHDLTALGYEIRPVFHQAFGREPVDLAGFNACRRYPFTAFNFFAIARAS